MKVTCSAMEISFSNEQGRGYEEKQNDEQDIFSGADDMGENDDLKSEIEISNELNIGNVTSRDKKKSLSYPIEKLRKLYPIKKH